MIIRVNWERNPEIQLVWSTAYVVKYKVKEIAKGLLKHHSCSMLLMWTTKTAVCLKTKDIFNTFMCFNWFSG